MSEKKHVGQKFLGELIEELKNTRYRSRKLDDELSKRNGKLGWHLTKGLKLDKKQTEIINQYYKLQFASWHQGGNAHEAVVEPTNKEEVEELCKTNLEELITRISNGIESHRKQALEEAKAPVVELKVGITGKNSVKDRYGWNSETSKGWYMAQVVKINTVPTILAAFGVNLHLFAHLIENALARKRGLRIDGSGQPNENTEWYIVYVIFKIQEEDETDEAKTLPNSFKEKFALKGSKKHRSSM
eukprot:TRINITY_DN9333_c0_g1_i1.p1 TRINITY_DN9333_c0_g1~~TRINITY_DN9333_c0_g1_i1.p1  ORF type:complete len:253 (-),score=47.80 TRINITY_DN9333_c0_g1_i1:100-831(-)